MGWFGSGSGAAKVSTVKEANDSARPQQFLEDLPPKFEDSGDVSPSTTKYGDVITKIKLSDFTIDRYVSMPCFREAMITGFQAMGVLGTVTFLVHKNPHKALNWGVCGFFLGNVVGWEQCRSLRRKSFETVEAARQAKVARETSRRKNYNSDEDEALRKFKQVQEYDDGVRKNN